MPKHRFDDIARAVLAAFEAAVRAGKDLRDCYMAGIDAWQAHFPASPRCDAAKEAVAIILDENYPNMAAASLAARGAR